MVASGGGRKQGSVNTEKLKFCQVVLPRLGSVWMSSCGAYTIWVKGKTREGDTWVRVYAAQYRDVKPWICDQAGSLAEAKEICQEHKDGKRQ